MSSSSVFYAVVVSNESNEDEEAANLPVGVAVDDRVRRTSFTPIPEANNCIWHDEFYDNKHGIIAAFDRDMELVQKYHTKFLFAAMISLLVVLVLTHWLNLILYGISDSYFGWIVIVTVWSLCSFYFYRDVAKVNQTLNTQHVAMSTEGVRIDNSMTLSLTVSSAATSDLFSGKHSLTVLLLGTDSF
jgi:hypothetical protein